MLKIKRQDTVEVIKGKDKGKKGKVLETLLDTNKVLIEGINFAKKHRRPTRQDQQSGIVQIEMPISLANVMFFCKNCNRATRIGFTLAKDGSKTRICKKCKGAI